MKLKIISILFLSLLNSCATVNDWDLAGTLQYGNDQECIKFLQQNPKFVNHEMREIFSWPWSITAAAMYGKTETIKYMIEHGADIESTDTLGYTPLHAAVRENHIDTVEYILKQGVDVNLVKRTRIAAREYGPSPLTLAVHSKSPEMINYLLNAGANINGTPPEFAPPLFSALISGNKEITELLLNKGANPNILNIKGESAIDYAIDSCGGQNQELVLLIQQAIAKWKSQHPDPLDGSASRRRK